jgi:hypothetical protein
VALVVRLVVRLVVVRLVVVRLVAVVDRRAVLVRRRRPGTWRLLVVTGGDAADASRAVCGSRAGGGGRRVGGDARP